MESIGDEKRIRALFSEVRFADEQTTPSFTAVWHRAQSRSSTRSLKPRRAFNLSFVAATALFVFALSGFGLWMKYSQPAPSAVAYAEVPANASFKATTTESGSKTPAIVDQPTNLRPSVKPRVKRAYAQKDALMLAANRRAAKEAQAVASWESPTATLLSSPSDNLFKTLPQLNENANSLKSFLPSRDNEKEN